MDALCVLVKSALRLSLAVSLRRRLEHEHRVCHGARLGFRHSERHVHILCFADAVSQRIVYTVCVSLIQPLVVWVSLIKQHPHSRALRHCNRYPSGIRVGKHRPDSLGDAVVLCSGIHHSFQLSHL